MQQDQDIKGFTILELLVVIAIIAIISAVAFPSFSKWSTERKVITATEKVASMISNIATQTQRGNLAYSQLMVLAVPQQSSIFVTKGMGDKNFKDKLEKGQINCPVSPTGYWDDFGKPTKKIQGLNFSEYYEFLILRENVIGSLKLQFIFYYHQQYVLVKEEIIIKQPMLFQKEVILTSMLKVALLLITLLFALMRTQKKMETNVLQKEKLLKNQLI